MLEKVIIDMITDVIIYADNNDSSYDLPGARMSYFYMHGEAEARAGYDCCNGNIEALRMCMKSGAFIANLKFPDGTEELCIVSSRYSPEGHITGIVSFISDEDATKFAFKKFPSFPIIYEHEKAFLRGKYPKVIENIKETVDNFKHESRVPKKILTEKEVEEGYIGFLTVGRLKKNIEDFEIPDEAKVFVQRIEDVYYKKNGWGVVLKEGYHFHSSIELNEKMKEEIARRERGEEPEYDKIEDPNVHICEDENFLNEIKEQYTPAWCVSGYKDSDNLFLNLHY